MFMIDFYAEKNTRVLEHIDCGYLIFNFCSVGSKKYNIFVFETITEMFQPF